MAHAITLAVDQADVVLPNGLRYQGGDSVTLSDEEYAQLPSSFLNTLTADNYVSGGGTVSLPVPVADGGTGAATQQAALDTLAGAHTSHQVLAGNGTHVTLRALAAADLPVVKSVISTLTDGSSIAVDASLGNIFTVTIAGSRTLANPSNPADGQQITVVITQGSGGSHLMSFDTAYDFGTAGAPTLSTAAGKADVLCFQYVGALSKWCCLYSALGF
jgi:hypothetical protein